DISIAAGPFLQRLSDGFAAGAANFSKLVAQGRESGSLADYLDRAGDSLARWWRIVKNLTATVVNYGSAARDFNDRMSSGFEKLTEGWRAASQAAKQEGSPFKTWLNSDELADLLSETRGLFGDFFRWFARETMDVQNIQMWTDLVRIIRQDL